MANALAGAAAAMPIVPTTFAKPTIPPIMTLPNEVLHLIFKELALDTVIKYMTRKVYPKSRLRAPSVLLVSKRFFQEARSALLVNALANATHVICHKPLHSIAIPREFRLLQNVHLEFCCELADAVAVELVIDSIPHLRQLSTKLWYRSGMGLDREYWTIAGDDHMACSGSDVRSHHCCEPGSPLPGRLRLGAEVQIKAIYEKRLYWLLATSMSGIMRAWTKRAHGFSLKIKTTIPGVNWCSSCMEETVWGEWLVTLNANTRVLTVTEEKDNDVYGEDREIPKILHVKLDDKIWQRALEKCLEFKA